MQFRDVPVLFRAPFPHAIIGDPVGTLEVEDKVLEEGHLDLRVNNLHARQYHLG